MSTFLIIQTAFFGDVILMTAMIEQLAIELPNVQVDVLVQKSREVLLENNPHVREVMTLDKKDKIKSTISIIRKIRKKRYDKVINVHRHGSSGWITWLSGAGETVGFNAHPMSFLFHKKIHHQQEGRHEIERNYDLLSHLISGPIQKPKLYPSPTDYKKVEHESDYVTISPASVWFTKKWPNEKWAKLIDHFPQGLDVFLLGGPDDRELCHKIEQQTHRRVIIKAGEYSFLESAALMKQALMNYANDSAPVHMASAVNAPVTTLFLSTVPAFGYGPLSDHKLVMEHKGELDCRPCGIHGWKRCPKGHFKCSEIEPEAVFESSMRHLNNN